MKEKTQFYEKRFVMNKILFHWTVLNSLLFVMNIFVKSYAFAIIIEILIKLIYKYFLIYKSTSAFHTIQNEVDTYKKMKSKLRLIKINLCMNSQKLSYQTNSKTTIHKNFYSIELVHSTRLHSELYVINIYNFTVYFISKIFLSKLSTISKITTNQCKRAFNLTMVKA
jgi:hypothetical protein